MIKNMTLTAVYDGIQQVEMDCKLNTDTKEVFDINVPSIVDNFVCFQGFYLNMKGVLHPINQKNETKDGDYWYE